MAAMKVPVLASIAIACCVAPAALADPAGGSLSNVSRFPGLRPWQTINVREVAFRDPRWAPVKVVRGVARVPLGPGARNVEVRAFGKAGAQKVTVVRGAVAAPEPSRSSMRVERISFAEPRHGSVTVFRGVAGQEFTAALFAPARDGELDRIAFAVDGIESRHGADLGMWRPELAGPQGPMQVSLAAALDVGGGDRFDLRQNRLLGRAYPAQMFRRYGNWADALAAYNWGPGNLDNWIAGGRSADRLPLEVFRYVARVLRDSLVADRSVLGDVGLRRQR
jgi:hypothetical protein